MEAYTSHDILEVDDEIVTTQGDGDVATVTYSNDVMAMKTGKNGNTVAAHNEMGREADATIRVLKGGYDDKRFNSKLVKWKNRADDFEPMKATFTKVIRTDTGIVNEVTTLKFGIPVKCVETKENVEGDTEQCFSLYTIRFGDSNRALS